MKQSIFRNIRRKLLNEGKLFRYLTYAIGEVILIIVGIFFALQLNNWNESLKEQKEFDRYIEQLIGDVKTAIRLNQESSEWYTTSAQSHVEIIQFLEKTEYEAEALASFENRLRTMGRSHEPQVEFGLLAELFQGDTSIMRRHEKLYEETLSRIGDLKITLNIVRRLQAAIEERRIWLAVYRAADHKELPDLTIRYDLDKLRSSTDFTYSIQNMATYMMILSLSIDIIIESFEEYLFILEEYE